MQLLSVYGLKGRAIGVDQVEEYERYYNAPTNKTQAHEIYWCGYEFVKDQDCCKTAGDAHELKKEKTLLAYRIEVHDHK